MNHIMMSTTIVAAVLGTLTACNGDSSTASNAANAQSSAVARRVVKSQEVAFPCEWVPAADVEQILGEFPRAPRRGFSAKTPRPDGEGAACLYPVKTPSGEVEEVAVQVDLYGAAEFESAMGMLGTMFSAELNPGQPESKAPEKRTDGWDYVSALPGVAVWRIGHVAIQIGDENLHVAHEKLDRIALAYRERIADLPFAMPGANPNSIVDALDPCALLTRADAEAVLGKLVVEPYRSAENSAIAEGDGPSCSYYAEGHRALIVTPTWSDGAMMFDMAGGIGGLVRSGVGGADDADLLDGPWDKATGGTSGSLYFLKGDKLLEMIYRTSSTDIDGAAKLARAAVGRL